MQLCLNINKSCKLSASSSYKPVNHRGDCDKCPAIPFVFNPIPVVDFEESIKPILDEVDVAKTKSNKKVIKAKTKLKAEKSDVSKTAIKTKSQHKAKNEVKTSSKKRKAPSMEDLPKSKVPKLNGVLGKVIKPVSHLRNKLKERNKTNKR